MDRTALADLIHARLLGEEDRVRAQYAASRDTVGHFTVDQLLPDAVARQIHQAFPAPADMVLRKSLREYKYIAAQMDRHPPILEEVVYAFQDPRIVSWVSQVTGMRDVFPDEHLYAGGISLMGPGNFLNPHLDNSHDKDRDQWRVLNLLYYVTPEWDPSGGGALELWPKGPRGPSVVLPCAFNRLAVMATHDRSWHSVAPITAKAVRCCVSNYYFSPNPPRSDSRFHVTSFRGRPEQRVRDAILRADAALRMGIRRVFRKGVRENPHVYQKPSDN